MGTRRYEREKAYCFNWKSIGKPRGNPDVPECGAVCSCVEGDERKEKRGKWSMRCKPNNCQVELNEVGNAVLLAMDQVTDLTNGKYTESGSSKSESSRNGRGEKQREARRKEGKEERRGLVRNALHTLRYLNPARLLPSYFNYT